jgi:hypothetical protein
MKYIKELNGTNTKCRMYRFIGKCTREERKIKTRTGREKIMMKFIIRVILCYFATFVNLTSPLMFGGDDKNLPK